MRLWTIHPRYLDTKGLLAAWREGLLAQKVLQDQTQGYKSHPQLIRFRSSADPCGSVSTYLRGIFNEALERGYNFSGDKISSPVFDGKISCTRGQLLYEWAHLQLKLKVREPHRYAEICHIVEPDPHPLFDIVNGGVEEWERVYPRESTIKKTAR